MYQEEELRQINDKIITLAGRDVESSKAKFKVVYSNKEFERRYIHDARDDHFAKYGSVQTVPKYLQNNDQYIVERLFANNHKDVYEGEWTYEPLFAFPSGLPLKWEMIELVIKKALEILPSDEFQSLPLTEQEANYRHEERKKKESAQILNMLDSSTIPSALHDGSAVGFTTEKVFRG